MDDAANEVLKTATEVILKPFTKVVGDAVGIIGGDYLSEYRQANREKIQKKFSKVMSDSNAKDIPQPNVTFVIQILEAAQEENRDELQDIWAKLIAAAIDPAKSTRYRREYVDIVKKFEPLDARVLMALDDSKLSPSQRSFFATQYKVSEDQIELAMKNLVTLGCAIDPLLRVNGFTQSIPNVSLSALGRELRHVLQ